MKIMTPSIMKWEVLLLYSIALWVVGRVDPKSLGGVVEEVEEEEEAWLSLQFQVSLVEDNEDDHHHDQ